MSHSTNLNLICAGFPRCGTTALSKYFEAYTNVKVLRDPNSGAYEYNGFCDSGMDDYYNSELQSNDHLFHKFSGYTYIKNISKSLNATQRIRNNTVILFMLGNQYDRLQSWHAFHRSKAISGADKSHFTYTNRDFYSNCSLGEYYHEFARKRIDYLSVLSKIIYTLSINEKFVIRQDDLRKHPERIFQFLSDKLKFDLNPITNRLTANSTILEPGITLETDGRLEEELHQHYLQTVSWAKGTSLLVDIDNYSTIDRNVQNNHTLSKPNTEVFKPVKLRSLKTINLNTVLVIGNGPSASLVNFDTLRRLRIPACGMNSAYRLWERIDYRPNYYICMDSVVIKSHAPAICNLIDENRIQQFFLRNEFLDLYPRFRDHPRITWFDSIRSESNKLFTTNWITTGSWSLRWMLHLGYKLISVIGVDANYQEILKEATKAGKIELSINKTPKYNPNYFFDDYQQAGDEYNIPNDPQYVAKHGTTVHADAVIKVREDMDKLDMSSKIYDLSPISEHNAFPKLTISNYFSAQEASLTTSFYFQEGKKDEARLNAKALCYNLNQARVSSINLLFEGEFSRFYELLSTSEKSTIDFSLSNRRLILITIDKRPSYLDLFNAAKNCNAPIAIVTNSDLVYSDELIELICTSFSVQSPRSVYCLTRWNQTDNGTFLQGQVPTPPWQEISAEHMELLSDVNYLSYDTYVFNRDILVPISFAMVYIGTFGCDTAIAAILRATGIVVTNPCLDLKAIHIDNKPRNYSGETGTRQVLENVNAFKSTLIAGLIAAFADSDIIATLESTSSTSLSIGTPTHALGWWYCLFRMFGASPWVVSSDNQDIKFEKFNLDPNSLLSLQDELRVKFRDSMRRGDFLEIVIDGSNGDHYLGCFNQSEGLKEIKNQLFRYDRQYVLFEQDVHEKTRREFDKFMLYVKSQFHASNKGSSENLYTTTNIAQFQALISNSSSDNGFSTNAKRVVQPSNRTSAENSQKLSTKSKQVRMLIIDPTPLGNYSATGQIKKTLFGHLGCTNMIQVWEHTGADPGLRLFIPSDNSDPNSITPSCSKDELFKILNRFAPTIIYFRSTASEELHRFHHQAIDLYNISSIIHIMDDWEARMIWDKNKNYVTLSELLRKSIQQSQVRLTICSNMTHEFTRRYKCNWMDLSNAVDFGVTPISELSSTTSVEVTQSNQVVVKYMGGLADDMNATSILEIATAIEELSNEGINVLFEIYTMSWYMDWANQHLSHFKSISVKPLVSKENYSETIKSADILLIAYNFDDRSIAYTRLSMANKLPEILATGKMLFAYGPLDIATIEKIDNDDLGAVVSLHDTAQLKNHLRKILLDQDLRRSQGERGLSYARRNYSLRQARHKVNALISLAMAKKTRH